ncbi:hypothetical protein AACB42_15790, partial [Enterococcus faecium]
IKRRSSCLVIFCFRSFLSGIFSVIEQNLHLKDPKVSNHRCPQCHKKMVIIEGKNGRSFKCKFCSITEKIPDKKERKQKMTKHEERRLMKKYSQPDESEESALAQALKAAMNQE